MKIRSINEDDKVFSVVVQHCIQCCTSYMTVCTENESRSTLPNCKCNCLWEKKNIAYITLCNNSPIYSKNY